MVLGQGITEWGRSPSTRRKLRAIALEFAIVLVGVFAAQALANWVAERDAYETMDRAKGRAEAEIAADMGAAQVWLKATPCIRDRMKTILRQAAVGPLPEAQSDRPSMKTLYFTPFSDETALLLRRRYGDERAHLFDMIRYSAESLNNRAGRLAAAWGRLALADANYGAVTAWDRLAAREAASDILAELRGIEVVATNVLNYGAQLGQKPDFSEEPGFGPATSCAAIWASGRSDPPLS